MSSDSDNKNEQEKLIEGHTYDGIQEYDNPMPKWWVNLFWITIFFAYGYCVYYMTGIGPSHVEEYEMEMKLAEAEKKAGAETTLAEQGSPISISERLVLAALSADSISGGKEIYASKCMPCHGDKGQGLIGPNLTDDHWIHGGSMEEILNIINVGVVAKGMVPWENQLSEDERINLVAFIRSIQGTKVEGKAPEGEIAVPSILQ